jgi:hypothetical protein
MNAQPEWRPRMSDYDIGLGPSGPYLRQIEQDFKNLEGKFIRLCASHNALLMASEETVNRYDGLTDHAGYGVDMKELRAAIAAAEELAP